MALLLHSCCGPCLGGTLPVLNSEKTEFVAFWQNPNIHPYIEYRSRYESFLKFVQANSLSFIPGDVAYGLEDFLRAIGNAGEGGRCRACFEMRLRAASRAAKQKGFEAFSTTLLISPFQNHELLVQVGEQAAKDVGLPFFYRDFRPAFQGTRNAARNWGLYRQKYCGCIFSEYERFSADKRFGLPIPDERCAVKS